MTPVEFCDVIAAHIPEFSAWLERLREEIRERYLDTLPVDKLDRDSVDQAARMVAGMAELPRWSRVPWLVIERAREIAGRRVDERLERSVGRVVRCPVCRDDGLVRILDPRTVAEVRRTRMPPRFPYTCLALCTCEAGQRRGRAMAAARVGVYRPDRDIIAGEDVRAQYQELVSRPRYEEFADSVDVL